jgi:hypothetical protein
MTNVDWRTPYLALKDGDPKTFDAIMNSSHPDAGRFSHWLLYEVMPASRNGGQYAWPGGQTELDALFSDAIAAVKPVPPDVGQKFTVTVKMMREYSASLTLRARDQADADARALDGWSCWACSEGKQALDLGLPEPWDEHENHDDEPEVDTRFRCVDCGVDTHNSGEYYSVSDEVWAASGLAPNDGMLCLADLERRIGRELILDDFTAMVPRLDAWERHVATRRSEAAP